MARTDSIIRGLLNKGRAVRDIEEPWWSKRYGDVLGGIAELPGILRESKQWNERKNLQRQEIMSTFAKDTRKTYNNEDVIIQKERLQKYYDKYKGNMDETSLEVGQMYLDNFDLQIDKNDSFNLYEGRQDEEMKKVIDYLEGSGKIAGLEIGKVYTDKEVDKFREVFQGFTNYTEEFTNKHSDRLLLTANKHIMNNLAHGVYVNKFLLGEMFEDNKVDEVEYKAYNQSIANNSIKPILDYNKQQGQRIEDATTLLANKINTGVLEYQKTQDVMSNKIPVPGYGKMQDMKTDVERPVYYKDLPKSEQRKFTNNLLKLGEKIKFDNKTQIDRTGEDQLKRDYPNLFGTKSPTVGKQLTEENKASLKSLGYSDSDISGMKYESALDIVSKGTKKDISPYAEERRIISQSKQKGLKAGGNKVIDELIQLDKDEIIAKENIVSLKKEHIEIKDQKKKVDEEIEALEAVNIIAVGDEASKKKYKDLKKEQGLLDQKLRSGGSYREYSYLGRIDKLQKELIELEKKRNSNKKKLEQYLKVS